MTAGKQLFGAVPGAAGRLPARLPTCSGEPGRADERTGVHLAAGRVVTTRRGARPLGVYKSAGPCSPPPSADSAPGPLAATALRGAPPACGRRTTRLLTSKLISVVPGTGPGW